MQIVENGRLAFYCHSADSKYWDTLWENNISAKQYASALKGQLGRLEKPFIKHLPKTGSILEAGCGPGQYVIALRALGYDAQGVEWGRETVKKIKTLFPEVPIREGDATQLDAQDGHYAGYISLGVVEHRREGPAPFFNEAFRVLEPGGTAIFSVPYFNHLRRLKERLNMYRGGVKDAEFYQYAYSIEEFTLLLEKAGFSIIDQLGYDSYKGFKDEIEIFKLIFDRNLGSYHLGSLVQRFLQKVQFVEKYFGHMLLMVCKKRSRI